MTSITISDLSPDHFWSLVDPTPCGSDDCWKWLGKVDRGGYGEIEKAFGKAGTTRFQRRTFRAHRVAYELLVGPIPEGLQLDHLCRNRACVNPAHLEPVTAAENTRRSPLVGRWSRRRTADT